MPGHYGGMTKGNGKGKAKSKKPAPPGTHRMPDGKLMTGSTHSKSSKPITEKEAMAKAKAKSGMGNGKGSKAMKEKMAKLRAMKKK